MVFYSVIEMYLNETYSIKNHILLYYFSFSPRFFFPQIQTNNNHPWRMAQLVAKPALSFLPSLPDPICCMDHPLCVTWISPPSFFIRALAFAKKPFSNLLFNLQQPCTGSTDEKQIKRLHVSIVHPDKNACITIFSFVILNVSN